MTTVLCFGSFDPLHDGHRDFFRQARQQGDRLIVIVTRDAVIRAQKRRAPLQTEERRLRYVAAEPAVSEARLGEESVGSYALLSQLSFDVLALGYDQAPADAVVTTELRRHRKASVRIVRLKPFEPRRYKSSLLRQQ